MRLHFQAERLHHGVVEQAEHDGGLLGVVLVQLEPGPKPEQVQRDSELLG